ncbi:uncharacterized protein STAUR_2435 [Stigmatella aurantiaca DW4/3-1]|uniref:Uncharacterized protein n=1 Tax=Stigmatella aurantiaca (strain DW4/3-1) TaxID=378806 RepID=E3FGA4_STIAD|nr:uncharacterized protein STAUR_2435 [Stigmatella aurantiaca DW4/3-1]
MRLLTEACDRALSPARFALDCASVALHGARRAAAPHQSRYHSATWKNWGSECSSSDWQDDMYRRARGKGNQKRLPHAHLGLFHLLPQHPRPSQPPHQHFPRTPTRTYIEANR